MTENSKPALTPIFEDGIVFPQSDFHESYNTEASSASPPDHSIFDQHFTNCTLVNGTNPYFVFSETDSLIAWSMGSAIAIVGTLLNLTTIFSLLNHKIVRQQPTTPFIISLASSDLIFSSVTLPILATRFREREWPLSSENGFACQIFPVIFYGNTAATLLNILAVTIYRWVMIFLPNRADRIFSRVRSKIIIAFCWIIPILMTMPSLSGIWGRHGLECHTQSCTIMAKEGGTSSPKTFLMTIGVVLPSVILVITNSMIHYKILKIRKRMEFDLRNSASDMPKALKEREQRLTRMMLIIFACFIMSYLPSYFVKAFFDKHYNYPTLHVICYAVNWMAVVMDPCIYVATQERYRQAVHLLWLRIKFCSKPEKYRQAFRRPSLHISQIRSSDRDERENQNL